MALPTTRAQSRSRPAASVPSTRARRFRDCRSPSIVLRADEIGVIVKVTGHLQIGIHRYALGRANPMPTKTEASCQKQQNNRARNFIPIQRWIWYHEFGYRFGKSPTLGFLFLGSGA